MLLYIVRHGDPIYNPDSLTELGKLQADAVAKRLAAHGIDEIYSSPLFRAQFTAQPTAVLTKNEVQIEEWMSESLAWQDFTVELPDGFKTWIFQSNHHRKLLCSREISDLGMKWYEHEMFKGSSFESGYKRILDASDAFLEKLGYVHDRENCVYIEKEKNDKRIATFSHAGFGLSWIGTLLDIPLPISWARFDVSHTGVTVVDFTADENGICVPTMLTLSNDSHLYREGLPTKYNNWKYI